MNHISSQPGEFPFSETEFARVATIARDHAGISLKEGKRTMVYARLSKRVRRLGLDSFRQYLDYVEAPENAPELDALIAALTTNVTAFFRENHHFRYLSQHLLPHWVAHARAGGRVRIWSSACSTGEEPYSIALLVHHACPDAAKLDIRILATDVNEQVVVTARDGCYPVNALDQIPKEFQGSIERHSTSDDQIRIADPVKSLVTFRKLNLFDDWPFRGKFDAIFCRNVAIYFDKPTQEKLWMSLTNRLMPSGHLFIGHSERITGPAEAALRPKGVTLYSMNELPSHSRTHTSNGRRICH